VTYRVHELTSKFPDTRIVAEFEGLLEPVPVSGAPDYHVAKC